MTMSPIRPVASGPANGQMRPNQESKDKTPVRWTAGPYEYKP